MNELFNNLVLKREERKAFPKHFLASVHCEVRLTETSTQVLENKENLRQAISTLGFQECQDVNQAQMTLINKSGEPPIVSQKLTPLGLKFISHEPKREIQITNGAITISDFAYDNLENFLKRFQTLFNQIEKILNISKNSKVNKVGLRKISSVVIKPVTYIPDSLSIFNPNLFVIARSGLAPIDSFTNSEEVIVLQKENQFSIIRTKLNKIKADTLEANLDFDLVSRSESDFGEIFSKTLLALNQIHFDLFMWSVTKEMIQLMETP